MTEAFVLCSDKHVCGVCKKWDHQFEHVGVCRYKRYLNPDGKNKTLEFDSCSVSLREGDNFK